MSASRRVVGRIAFAIRTSALGITFGAAGGFVAQAVLPLQGVWIAGAVAATCIALFVLLIVTDEYWAGPRAGRPPVHVRGMDRVTMIEKSGTLSQFGHAFATAGLALGAFALGAWLAGIVGG